MKSRPIPKHCAGRFRRRGAALVAFVAALLVIGTFVLWGFDLTGTTATTSLSHFLGTGALYAAESGIEMSVREIGLGVDFDNEGTGTMGTISNNGNSADDPAIAAKKFFVEQTSPSPPTYRATGRPNQAQLPWSSFRRVIEIRTE